MTKPLLIKMVKLFRVRDPIRGGQKSPKVHRIIVMDAIKGFDKYQALYKSGSFRYAWF